MKTLIKILIAEHDPADLELMHHELKRSGVNYLSETVETECDFSNALDVFNPDVILCDYSFPSFDGATAFKIRENLAPFTPFIFVSGAIGEEKLIELIKNGVTDFVLKDKMFTLISKLTRALKDAEERRQKEKTERELLLSESQLARAQQIAHMGSWELNFASNIVRLSTEASCIYGLPPGQNLQPLESTLSFVHPSDATVVLDSVNQSRTGEPFSPCTYRIIRTDGSVRHIYAEGKAELDVNNIPTGLYGIMQDITERVLLENRLMHERETKQREITAAVITAQEKERKAVGTELHDNLNQVLVAAKMYVDMAKSDEENRYLLLEQSSAYLVTVIEEIRRIAKTLISPDKQVGLFISIRNLIDDLVQISPVKLTFKPGDDVDEDWLDEKLQVTIFRIVQEQVNNIVQHSGAANAFIVLSKADNAVVLVISDDGAGAGILENISGTGITNINIFHKVHNGTATVTSSQKAGYELKVILPVNNYMYQQLLVMQ